MLFKSKSVITVIGLGLFALVCVIAGALILNRPDITEFSTDGYILSASEEEGAENVMVSEQIWFGQGSSWKTGKEEVRFSDAQGDAVQVPSDSFIHYSDNSISAVTDVSVMSLDDYARGVIQYYVLKQGVPMNWDGSSYTIGEGADAVSFRSFLIKSSDEHYLLGGESLNLIQSNGQAAHVDNGYLELTYLADDKSVALLNDGTNAWQILTEGAVIELGDGTTMNLSKGQLELPQMADGQTQQGFYVDDIEINASRENIWNKQNGYPVYRFTVLNGQDGESGQDGAAGEDGVTGEDGDEGEQGTDGSSDQSGAAGSNGNSGSAGTIGEAGAGGGQMSGVSVSTTIPVVSLKTWSVNGKALKFTVYTDEVSCNSIVEGTTRISLVDTNTGKEVYYWDGDGDFGNTGLQIDLSEDSADGFELYCNVLEPGHQYRLSVTAEYIVNDVTGSQELLSRNFTADDYGLSFELTDRTNDTFTFSMKKSNQLVTVDSVDVYVDDVLYGTMTQGQFEDYTIDLNQLPNGSGKDHANRTHQISFRPRLEVNSFNENGESITTEVGADGSIHYDYTVTTLKNEPTVGGIRLTAYDSGYLMAEVLGKYEGNNKYGAVSDPDGTIQKIRFELYDDYDDMYKGTSPIAVQESTSGYLAYFTVSEDNTAPIHTGQNYYVRAYYTYSDGAKEMNLPVMETYGTTDHPSNSFAWDIAKPTSLVSSTMSFEGNSELYNNNTEATEGTNQGITFNEISGNICAAISSNNRYIVSAEHPMELQISANPDYYKALQYGSYNPSNQQMSEVDASVAQPEIALNGYTTLKMQVDLTGLRANTAYMFTLYGYENNNGTYNRVTMGSVAVTTRSIRSIELKMERDSADQDGIGVKLRLGGSDSQQNYYDIDSHSYTDKTAYRKNTNAAYRSLNSITFELYRKGTETPIGTCTIENTSTSPNVDENSIYEAYYGSNAEKTFQNYKNNNNYKGIVGVGKDRYPYCFLNADGEPLQQGELTSGEYCIKASVIYDYTEKRYDYMALNPDSQLYNYYTYKAEQKEYINEINVWENSVSSATSAYMEAESLPYAEPSQLQMDDRSYIKVETLTNDKLGAYNGDDDQNSLYSENWNKDTIAGLQLTTKYMNDADTQTDTLTFYGFTYDEWDQIGQQENPTDLKDGEGRYTVKCTLDLGANKSQIVPKVWLLFYNEDDLPKLAEAALEPDKTGISPVGSSEGKGCLYRRTTTNAAGETVEIFYMDRKYFSRGQSYVFMYETELPDYIYKDANQTTQKGFSFPKDYFTNMQSTVYNKMNTLKSNVVSVKRQIPVVYSTLEKTEVSGGSGTDQWKVYVNDPDSAIHWSSILESADNNHLPAGGSQAATKGGIYDLYDIKLPSPLSGSADDGTAKYLTFEFGFQNRGETKRIDTKTVFDPEKENVTLTPEEMTNKCTAEELKSIQSMMTYTVRDDTYEVTERGGNIKVTNLPSEGISYELLVDYLLLDDVGFDAATSYSNLPIIQHNYIGSNDYSEDKNKLQFAKAEAAEDHNTMYIYLDPSEDELTSDNTLKNNYDKKSYQDAYYLSKAYLNKARTIAAVSLEAHNDTKNKDIYDRDSVTGEMTNKKKVLWIYPEAPEKGTDDYRYFLKFKLSDLDKTTKDDIQYSPNDELTFTLKVYYLTGAGGLDSSDYIDDKTNYALKYVNYIKNGDLYGTGTKADAARYRYTTNGTVQDSEGSAGRSFFHAKALLEKAGTLPWSQQYTITSAGFDSKCVERTLNQVDLESMGGYKGRSVLEAMVVKSYDAGKQPTITVESAAPALQNAKASGGIVQINLQADVENWNLVEYPDKEKLHLYYLIYNYSVNDSGKAEKGDLAGAMIGEGDADTLINAGGKLNLTFPFSTQNQKYWIEVYYKDKAAAGNSFNSKTDASLFTYVSYTSGTLYQDQTAEQIEAIVAGNTADPVFRPISGINNRLLVETGSGLEMSDVQMTLGAGDAYKEKKLNVAVKITSDILDSEKDTLKLFYRLERCGESEDQSDQKNWQTVIAEKEDTGVTNWAVADGKTPEDENYWSYYDSGEGGKDITLTPPQLQQNLNRMMVPYYAGGVIRPGYAYRIQAAIYQKGADGKYALVSRTGTTTQPDGYRVSNVEIWRSTSLQDDQQALVQTTNVIRGSDNVKLDYRISDLNGTSLDGKYFVRLAEKQPDGTYRVLEGDESIGYYNKESNKSYINLAHTMGSTYQRVTFGQNGNKLKPNTTYRLQFYGMMDLEYDNKLNYTSEADSKKGLLSEQLTALGAANMLNIMDRDRYYPRKADSTKDIADRYSMLYDALYKANSYDSVSTGLKLASFDDQAKNSLMIGYSNDFKTLEETATATAGTYQQTVIANPNLITLKFTGAYNAGEISRVLYSLEKENGNSQWDMVTVDKADGITSLFDSTGSGAQNDGLEGKVSLRLALGDANDKASMNVKEKGKYVMSLVMQKYDQNTKSYVTLGSYSVKFNNTTDF